MVTVLFVGSALTAVSSAGAYMAIQEFRAMGADGRAAEALALAEAGVDRFLLAIRQGDLNWNRLYRAGCEDTDSALAPWLQEAGSLGTVDRTYDARVSVVDCATRPTEPSNEPSEALELEIASTGEFPAARRVIVQRVNVLSLGLPIGVYADSVDANGNGGMTSISLISSGNFTGREKVSFVGDDPYYTEDHVYDNGDDSKVPAAPHVSGRLTFTNGTPEHPGPAPTEEKNCNANGNSGTAGQSLWDSDGWTSLAAEADITSGCQAPHDADWPPTSLFTDDDLDRMVPKPELDEDDYETLAQAAQSNGIHCTGASNATMSCTKVGSTWPFASPVEDTNLSGLSKQFIMYVNYTAGDPLDNEFKWHADDWETCSSDPTLHESVIIVIRNGGISMQSGAKLTGAIIAPDGEVDSQGSFEFHGTVIAKKFWYRGNAEIELSPCWVQNMPGPFLNPLLAGWSEVDR